MFGLSHGNTDSNYTDLDFGCCWLTTGELRVVEDGTVRGTYGTYAAGDLLQVSVESGVVKYSRNGELLYTSTLAAVYPLLVDTALYTQATTLNSAVLMGNWMAPTPVEWTEVVGVTASGNNLTKTAATGWGNAGAISTLQLASGDGYVEFAASETTTARMLGLSNGNSNASYTDLDFALYANAGQLMVYEAGVSKGTFGAYATGDKLRVAVSGGVVTYLRNGTVSYSSAQSPVYPLLVDAALYTQGATLQSAMLAGNWRPPTPPIPVPIISATKGVSGPGADGKYEEGDRVTYTIVVTNSGLGQQGDNAGDELTDVLPSGLTLVSATSATGVVGTSGNTVNWDGVIAPGGGVTLTIEAKIGTGTQGTTVSNQATVLYDGDGDGTNNSSVATPAVSFRVAMRYPLSVTMNGGGVGDVVSIPPALDCGPTCSASFVEGTVVTLTATASSGSFLSGWSGACAGSAASCQVTMDAAKTVVATFDVVGEAVPVVWTSVVGATASGNSLTKTASTVGATRARSRRTS